MTVFLAVLFAIVCTARAEVKLPAIFSDHTVLQADTAAAVWGWAAAGEDVTVSIATKTQSAKGDASGKWNVRLEKLQASSTPQTLTVRGAGPVAVRYGWVGNPRGNLVNRAKLPVSPFRTDDWN